MTFSPLKIFEKHHLYRENPLNVLALISNTKKTKYKARCWYKRDKLDVGFFPRKSFNFKNLLKSYQMANIRSVLRWLQRQNKNPS